MVKQTILLAAVSATVVLAAPDSLGWLAGRVTEAKTGLPVHGVGIIVRNGMEGAATGNDGRYVFAVPAGRHWLEATYIGMLDDSALVSVAAAETVVTDFALRPDLRWLDEAEADRLASREQWRRNDSIRPYLDRMEWDATLLYNRYYARRLLPADPALADSVRVRALRAWRTGSESYFARVVYIDPRQQDTVGINYLLVEDGRCTAVLQPSQYQLHDVLAPEGCVLVYFRSDTFTPDSERQEDPWNDEPSARPLGLQLRLQVPDLDKPRYF